jgi:hypothetical protein
MQNHRPSQNRNRQPQSRNYSSQVEYALGQIIMVDQNSVSVQQIQRALARCMDAEGVLQSSSLPPEASALCEVLGGMYYLREDARQLSTLSKTQRGAVLKWSVN